MFLDHEAASAVMLSPGEGAAYDLLNGNLYKTAVNLTQVTAWTRGELLLLETPSSDLFRMLERHYNIQIINENAFLSRQNFSGRLKLDSGIVTILDLLKTDTPFEYELEGDQVLIKKSVKSN